MTEISKSQGHSSRSRAASCDVVGTCLKIWLEPVELDPLILFCALLVVDLSLDGTNENPPQIIPCQSPITPRHTVRRASITRTDFYWRCTEMKSYDFELRESKFDCSSLEIAPSHTFCVCDASERNSHVRRKVSFLFCGTTCELLNTSTRTLAGGVWKTGAESAANSRRARGKRKQLGEKSAQTDQLSSAPRFCTHPWEKRNKKYKNKRFSVRSVSRVCTTDTKDL